MKGVVFIAYCLHSLLCFGKAGSNLINNLKYYEILHSDFLKHTVIKRGATDSSHPFNRVNEIELNILGHNFRLIVSPRVSVLHPKFTAYVIDAAGREKNIHVNFDDFYTGRVFGQSKSKVKLHVENGIVTGTIHLPDETYHIEPSWRHLPRTTDNRTMITYKESDIKFDWHKYKFSEDRAKWKTCGYIKELHSSHSKEAHDQIISAQHRIKRETKLDHFDSTRTKCPLLLVADYRFYHEMGGGNSRTTVNYLISLIDRVDKMYSDTDWTDSNSDTAKLENFGFVIKKIIVHQYPTNVSNGNEHYNMLKTEWDVRKLLEVFSRNVENRNYCLSHLFTHQTFENRVVLGLAYIASARPYSPGGICSIEYKKGEVSLYLNSGLSSSRNHYGQRVITREADLVTAHEFGHNWGSEHDPDISECSPSARHGGSYLMHTYSVSGYDHNNKLFSPCSKRSIRNVLLAKSHLCFTEPQESFCGNLRVESDEECDAGLLGSEDNDLCCDKNCKLKSSAKCSDKNSPCCENCQFSRRGVKCREAQYPICEQESYCSGTEPDCPKSFALPDGTNCQERGKCRNGTCMPFCETEGLQSCMCDTFDDACKRCCRVNKSAPCSPVQSYDILPDGTPCIQGFCKDGKCEKVVQDMVERIWKIIDDISINKVMKFLRDNVVGTVIIVTAVFWIPAACVVKHIDQKKAQEGPIRDQNDSDTANLHITGNQRVLYRHVPKHNSVPAGIHPVVTNVIPE